MRQAKRFLVGGVVGASLMLFAGSIGSAVSAASPSAATGAQQNPAEGMPPGPGHDITVSTCTKCHSISNVVAQHKTRDAWTETITKMVGYGATGSDDDFQAILDYVVKNYGTEGPPADGAAHAKIAVNKETAAQLVTDLGLTADESAAVVAYRDKNGSFKSVDDLKKVPGVDGAKFEAKKADLEF